MNGSIKLCPLKVESPLLITTNSSSANKELFIISIKEEQKLNFLNSAETNSNMKTIDLIDHTNFINEQIHKRYRLPKKMTVITDGNPSTKYILYNG